MDDQLNAQKCREVIAKLAALLPKAMATQFPRPPKFDFELEDEEIERTRWDPVFIGGGIVSLLITDAEAPQEMFTKDVDLVLEIASHPEFYRMERVLEGAGFRRPRDDHAEIISWVWEGVRVDLLPDRRIQSMPYNRWFVFLMEAVENVEVLPGCWVWRASAPCFLATKFEAFHDRGQNYLLKSKDLGDILAVVNGRRELSKEIPRAAPDVRGFLRQSFGRLLEQRHFLECLPELLPEKLREELVLRRIREICSV